MRKYALYLAWIFALLGVLLSVFSSEILRIEPCRLCWYQRCALFPLAILLGFAAYRNDRTFFRYGMVLAGLGCIVALMQVFIPTQICGGGCVEKRMLVGVLTLPMISSLGFAAIFGLLWVSREVP